MSIKYLLVKPPIFHSEYIFGAFTTPKDFDNTNNFVILIGGGGSGGSGTYYRDPDTALFRRSSGGGGGGGACIFAENIQLTPGEQYQYTVPGRNTPLTSFNTNSLSSESLRQDRSQSTRLWGDGVDLEAESGEPGESGWHSNIYGAGGTVLSSTVTADRTLVYAGGRGGYGVNSANLSTPLRYMSGAGGGASAGPNGRGGVGGSGRNEDYTSAGNQNCFAGSGGGSNGGDNGTNTEPTSFANQSLGGLAATHNTPYRSSNFASGVFRGSDGGPGLRFSNTWATNPGGSDDLIECHSTDPSGIIQFIFPASTNNLFNGNLGQSIQADSQSYDVITPGTIYNLRTSGGGSGGGGLGSAGGPGGGNANWPGGGGGGGGGASSGNYYGGYGSAGFMLIVWKSTTDSHLNFC